MNETHLATELALMITNAIGVNRAYHVHFTEIESILDSDTCLTLATLLRAGFSPAPGCKFMWRRGGVGVYSDLSTIFNIDDLTDLMDAYRPVDARAA
jgi:hypothetical protein